MDHYDNKNCADPVAETNSSRQPISGDKKEQPPLINTKALSEHAETYELEKFKKNTLIIFSHVKIDGFQEPRLGTEKDVEALKRTFSKFGFEVENRPDLTKKQIDEELKKFSQTDFSDYGCVAVAVLTHGSDNGLLRAKDQQYSEVEIFNYLKPVNNPSLVTKPKIIIIQACRGSMSVPGITVSRAGTVRRDCDDPNESYTLPPDSDMLILHSSYSGTPSHRDTIEGSYFIQELCKKIDSRADTEDLVSILTEVNKVVAIKKQIEYYNCKTKKLEINKQMPEMTSTLTRKLYLTKFGCATVVQSSSDSRVIVKSYERKQGDPSKVKRRRKSENATRRTAFSTSTLLSAAERKVYLHVSNFRLGTTTEMVLEHLRNIFPIDTCTATLIDANYDGYATFKLCVPHKNRAKYLLRRTWPKDIRVRMWPTEEEIEQEMFDWFSSY